MRDRGAERDPLLLAAGQLAGQRVGPVEEPDALEQGRGTAAPLGGRTPRSPSGSADELRGGQLVGERAPVVLVGVAERRARDTVDGRRDAAPRSSPPTRTRPGRGALEPRDDPHQRRLARAARPEHDAELALLDGERQPLEGGDASVLGRVDDEDVPRASTIAVMRLPRPRAGPRLAERTAGRQADERRATTSTRDAGEHDEQRVDGRDERRLRRVRPGGHRDDARHEEGEHAARRACPPASPRARRSAARADDRRRSAGVAPCASRS